MKKMNKKLQSRFVAGIFHGMNVLQNTIDFIDLLIVFTLPFKHRRHFYDTLRQFRVFKRNASLNGPYSRAVSVLS